MNKQVVSGVEAVVFSGASGTSINGKSILTGWSGSLFIDEEKLKPLGLYCKSGGFDENGKKTYYVFSKDGTMTYSEKEFKNLTKIIRLKKLKEIELQQSQY